MCQSFFINEVSSLMPFVFNEVLSMMSATLIKSDSGTGFYQKILRNISEYLFYKTLAKDYF